MAERQMPNLYSVFDGPCSCPSCWNDETEMPELEFESGNEESLERMMYEAVGNSLSPTIPTRNSELEQLNCVAGPSSLPSSEEPVDVNTESVHADDSLQILEDEQTIREIWVVGHSYIHWAEKKALQMGMENLGCDPSQIKVSWGGIRGMRWRALKPFLGEAADHCPTPFGIIIHLGGNDVGRKSNLGLISWIKEDLRWLSEYYPDTILIFSSIVLRPCWSQGAKWRGRRINNVLQRFLWREKGCMYHNYSLEGEQLDLFRDDGVHLSNEGNCIFVSNLRQMVELCLIKGGM
ncbi:uncharacterized protein LOC120921660 [Rana temporaria]|uniref:uncharacterized protein LOC120921660 n=1 Tax=Rana temporaria TaxID=8407 RepID=UPI001AAC8866|nr:uncharacterized protein LOC120921660 [Rana temporaria]